MTTVGTDNQMKRSICGNVSVTYLIRERNKIYPVCAVQAHNPSLSDLKDTSTLWSHTSQVHRLIHDSLALFYFCLQNQMNNYLLINQGQPIKHGK